MNLYATIITIKERHRNGFMRKNILSKIAMQLTIWSIEDCNQKQIPVIQYGLEILLENILKIVLILIISLGLGYGLKAALILLCFASIRFHAGGIHAKTNWGCTLLMFAVVAIGIIANIFLTANLPFFVVTWILCNFCIYKYAPNGNPFCLELEEHYKKQKRNYSFITVNFWFIVAAFSSFRSLIIITALLECVSLVVFFISERRCTHESL